MKILLRLQQGSKKIVNNRKKQICYILFLWLIAGLYAYLLYSVSITTSFLDRFIGLIYVIVGTILLLILPLLGLAIIGTPREALFVERQLEAIGMKNRAGETPSLIDVFRDPDNPKITVYRFISSGIPRSDWDSSKDQIEATLNATVIKTKYSNGRKSIDLYLVTGTESGIPERTVWDDSYESVKESVIVLGESVADTVYVDLNKTPHILIGGSSGSGKTVLFKTILHQCYQHGAKIIISDFKGGVDYPRYWHSISQFCDSRDELISQLHFLTDEIEHRKALLLQASAKNISEYNDRATEKLPRIIFGCDELAEMLDKTGLSKDDKAQVATIEADLATIARQGRAFGIHLVLATQRPDANILPGQIKNNMDIRVCGRADNTLSMIILDSTIAADEIEKDEQGKFILPDGTTFRGYYLDDEKINENFEISRRQNYEEPLNVASMGNVHSKKGNYDDHSNCITITDDAERGR